MSISYPIVYPPPYRCILWDSRPRALQSHDLSGEGITCGSYTYFFEYSRTWRASSEVWSARATSETRRMLETIHSIHSHIHSNKADMIRMITMAKWCSGNHVDLKLPDICLTGKEKPRKRNSARELVPTGDRNPAHCVTGARDTACSTVAHHFGSRCCYTMHALVDDQLKQFLSYGV